MEQLTVTGIATFDADDPGEKEGATTAVATWNINTQAIKIPRIDDLEQLIEPVFEIIDGGGFSLEGEFHESHGLTALRSTNQIGTLKKTEPDAFSKLPNTSHLG